MYQSRKVVLSDFGKSLLRANWTTSARNNVVIAVKLYFNSDNGKRPWVNSNIKIRLHLMAELPNQTITISSNNDESIDKVVDTHAAVCFGSKINSSAMLILKN